MLLGGGDDGGGDGGEGGKGGKVSSLPRYLPMQSGERRLLERYWRNLLLAGDNNSNSNPNPNTTNKSYPWHLFVSHWEIALVDWLRFQASWGFWGNTGWLEGRVRWILREGRVGATVLGGC